MKNRAIAYVQLQENLPKCIWQSFKKTRELWAGDIYLICPKREHFYEATSVNDVFEISKESINDILIKEYEDKTFLLRMYPEWDGFWDNACKRFIYLLLLMKRYNIDRLIHIENDVIAYLPIEQMFDSIEKIYGDKIVFTPHEPQALNCGFTYIGSVNILENFCNAILEYFKRGISWFNEKYPNRPIINETLFTFNFYQEHPEMVGLFPAMPGDANAKVLGFLIDPDGWGRWVDGVRYKPGKRYAAECHYIGDKILRGIFDVHFSFDGRKIKLPYVYNTITTECFPIATLHFNSKEPENWI